MLEAFEDLPLQLRQFGQALAAAVLAENCRQHRLIGTSLVTVVHRFRQRDPELPKRLFLGALVQRLGIDKHAVHVENQGQWGGELSRPHSISRCSVWLSCCVSHHTRNCRNAAPRWLYPAFSSALSSANVVRISGK